MSVRLVSVALGVFVLSATGCKQFPSVPYNKAAPNKPASVALAPIWVPEKPQMLIVGAVGTNFGLIGALVEVGRAASAATDALAAMTAAEFDYATAFRQRVARAFEEAGFAASALEGARASSEQLKFMKTLPAGNGAAAVADVVVTFVGFVAGGATTPYRPTLNIQLRLVEAQGTKVLFAEQIHYNHFNQTAPTAVALEPNADCAFQDVKAIEAEPKRAADCLAGAIDAVGAEITRQLR